TISSPTPFPRKNCYRRCNYIKSRRAKASPEMSSSPPILEKAQNGWNTKHRVLSLESERFCNNSSRVRTAEFDYDLPQELIAQHPVPQRDQSRLLVLQRRTGKIEHCSFHQLPAFLGSNDLLVLNDSRVIPARLRGRNTQTGGRFEMLLLE